MTEDAVTVGTGGTVRTTCPYCGVGCGVLATPHPDGGVAIAGDPDHPANFGRLCAKGMALGDTMSLDDRLLTPVVDGRPAGWDAALDRVASVFGETIAEHGPDSVAFYVSGQLLTEDYYVANKLMKGFIGSANIDTNSRLCMASAVAGHRRAFGYDTVPGTYEDLELADLVVLVGSNLAWCHPVLAQRLEVARKYRGTKIVVIDPRETATAHIADLHLPIAPGSDVALFNGLLDHLEQVGAVDAGFVSAHTAGFAEALNEARRTGLAGAASQTGLSEAVLNRFYDLFAATEKTVTVFSQGVNQSRVGTDKVNAILNCHLATGRIGRPGSGPFSVTGQPNAMGGREVGGLANMLAAHMDIDNRDHSALVGAYWRAPRLADKPGLNAVDLFRAVGEGRIKALWVMATNPAVSMPQADAVVAALKACPFVTVSDITADTDTARDADVLLPATGWGEKDGTVTNSERRISRQRAFVPPPGEARPDWWIVSQVARRMGFDGFDYGGPADIFREHAALTALANNGSRDLDLGGLAALDNIGYATMQPVQWPVPATGGETVGTAARNGGRLFADGRFYTPDGRARFIATRVEQDAPRKGHRNSLVLNTGRIRDQWHTMTRTGKAPRLMTHIAEPFVEIHPEDAARCGVSAAVLARVESRHGHIVVRVLVTDRQRRGSVFVPMHWTGSLAANARVDTLVTGETDPVSGQPELKNTPVSVTPFAAGWYGFAVLARRPKTVAADHWALARTKGGWRLELAGITPPADWRAWLRELIDLADDADWLTAEDVGARSHRFAVFEADRLAAAVFIGPEPVAVSRSLAAEGLTKDYAMQVDRLTLLAGRPGVDRPLPGPIVCSCFEVGANQVASAVAGGSRSVEAVGEALGAGTNCGSCRAEIRRIVDEHAVAETV